MSKVVALQHPVAIEIMNDGSLAIKMAKEDLKRVHGELAKAKMFLSARKRLRWKAMHPIKDKRPRWKAKALHIIKDTATAKPLKIGTGMCAETSSSSTKTEDALSDLRYDLLDDHRRALVSKVAKTGRGVCSRCRWSHGCHKCDEEKALRYHLGKQGYLGPAVWNCT